MRYHNKITSSKTQLLYITTSHHNSTQQYKKSTEKPHKVTITSQSNISHLNSITILQHNITSRQYHNTKQVHNNASSQQNNITPQQNKGITTQRLYIPTHNT
ncbi:Hypothetical predicted protein [Octopus vulgaris]|uniref:Uncharacterized protein n=1 Tax=Octopus vulgaris TaxID=6645 RepID=A0AA36C3E6_OCTVU|nr:Hypothetical predicted protein [Octopus vulgaris]